MPVGGGGGFAVVDGLEAGGALVDDVSVLGHGSSDEMGPGPSVVGAGPSDVGIGVDSVGKMVVITPPHPSHDCVQFSG